VLIAGSARNCATKAC